jgi:enoyl-CoA hydratase
VADYFHQHPGLDAGSGYDGAGFWELPITAAKPIDVDPSDFVFCDAEGYDRQLAPEPLVLAKRVAPPARIANLRGTMSEIEQRDRVTILRMARGKGNALNIEFTAALIEALDQLERSPARAGILTGQGSVFGAGVDLPALVEGGPEYVRRFVPLMQRCFERLATFPKPMVAAVNGHAIAGGAILMLACDQRLLARGSAQIGLTEVRVGVVFPAWALEIARFATPPEHLPTLLCTGRTWPPEEALARGLVDELVEPEQLLDRACQVAEELAAIPPVAFTNTKLALRRPMIEGARREAARNDAQLLDHWASPETLREVARFAASHIKRRA